MYVCTYVIFAAGWIRGKVNGVISVVPRCKSRGNREWRQPEIIGLLVRSGLIFSNKLHRACSRARCNNIHAHERACFYTTPRMRARTRVCVYRVACNRVVNLLLRKAEYRWRPCLSRTRDSVIFPNERRVASRISTPAAPMMRLPLPLAPLSPLLIALTKRFKCYIGNGGFLGITGTWLFTVRQGNRGQRLRESK